MGLIDMLNITPGAVYTEATKESLKDGCLTNYVGVQQEPFCDNIVRMMGRCTGTHYAHWIHSAPMYTPGLFMTR